MSSSSPKSFPRRTFGAAVAVTSVIATVLATLVVVGPVQALAAGQGPGGHPPHAAPPPKGGRPPHVAPPPHGVVVVDRGQPGWWRGHPGFVSYVGPRPGYYYAPGYGYYAIPRGYTRTTWVVGATLPPMMRSYVVISPAVYGLAPAPVGCGWYYAGANIVLVRLSTGVIIQSVAGGW
ncbi:RcnB family protein [Caulobacter sp.]|uniref:RcnB family protein n=1 Tax=Caulobacter sp. TaxID=78 RepID=UPI0031D7582E